MTRMNDDSPLLDKLAVREIKPTAMRLLILRTMMKAGRALSLVDIVDLLETVDKSTVSRTLSLFLSHHLVHTIDDGSGALKYAICGDGSATEVDDLHVHFFCTQCRRTFCLRGLPVPLVHLPAGFSLSSVNYVMKGVCADCRRQ